MEVAAAQDGKAIRNRGLWGRLVFVCVALPSPDARREVRKLSKFK